VALVRECFEQLALRTIMEARLSAMIWAGTTLGIMENGLPPRHEMPLWLPLRYFNTFMLDAPPLIAVFGADSSGHIKSEARDWRDLAATWRSLPLGMLNDAQRSALIEQAELSGILPTEHLGARRTAPQDAPTEQPS
jgi:hypothetical protein